MNPVVQIAPLQESDIETIHRLFAKQNTRQTRLDARLRRFRNDEVADYLAKTKSDQRNFLKFTGENGVAYAGALLNVIKYPDDSGMLALFLQLCGVARVMSLPGPDTHHATEIANFSRG